MPSASHGQPNHALPRRRETRDYKNGMPTYHQLTAAQVKRYAVRQAHRLGRSGESLVRPARGTTLRVSRHPTAYSDRNAWLGEIEDARRAGIKAAMSAERPSVRTAVMMTTEL